MALLTRNNSGAADAGEQADARNQNGGSGTGSALAALGSVSPLYKLVAGLAVVAIVMVVCLAFWGSGMEYPTTVSRSEVPTASGATITLEKTLRQQTGSAIDATVKWMTVSGDWLFEGISTAITYALIYIEDILKWVPWPALVVALTLLAFAM